MTASRRATVGRGVVPLIIGMLLAVGTGGAATADTVEPGGEQRVTITVTITERDGGVPAGGRADGALAVTGGSDASFVAAGAVLLTVVGASTAVAAARRSRRRMR